MAGPPLAESRLRNFLATGRFSNVILERTTLQVSSENIRDFLGTLCRKMALNFSDR